MSDLHTALEAAIRARMIAALLASPGPWHVNAEADEVLAVDGIVVCDGFALSGPQLRATTRHIARNDPAQTIRDCEYHLKVLKRHVPFDQPNWRLARGSFTEPGCTHCELTSNDGDPLARDWPCDDIADLLDVYPEVTR